MADFSPLIPKFPVSTTPNPRTEKPSMFKIKMCPLPYKGQKYFRQNNPPLQINVVHCEDNQICVKTGPITGLGY